MEKEKFTIKPLEWTEVTPMLIETTKRKFFFARIWQESESHWLGRYKAGDSNPSYIGGWDSAEKAKKIIESRYQDFVKETFLNPA